MELTAEIRGPELKNLQDRYKNLVSYSKQYIGNWKVDLSLVVYGVNPSLLETRMKALIREGGR